MGVPSFAAIVLTGSTPCFAKPGTALGPSWLVLLLTRIPHRGREQTRAGKLPLALGRADQHRDLPVPCGRNDRLERDHVGDVEMAERRSTCLRLRRASRSVFTTRSRRDGMLGGELLAGGSGMATLA